MQRGKTFAVIIAITATITQAPVATAVSFSDIPGNSETYTQVRYLFDRGIISGYPDGTFKPNQSINRAEALKIIFKTTNKQARLSNYQSPFPDVQADQWFAPYVSQAKELGIISGYPDGTYKPWREVNRAEFVKIATGALANYQEPTSHSAATIQYSDLDINEWYMPYLSFALENNYLDQERKFHPTESMKRGDAAKIIYKIAKQLESQAKKFEPVNTVITDPLNGNLFNNSPADFGPGELLVIHDINRTEVNNLYHGYQVSYEESLHVSGNHNTDSQLKIENYKDCSLDIYSHAHRSPQQFYESKTNAENFMEKPSSTELTKIEEYPDIEAYKISYKFTQAGNFEEYFVHENQIIYELSINNQDCQYLILQTLLSFKPL